MTSRYFADDEDPSQGDPGADPAPWYPGVDTEPTDGPPAAPAQADTNPPVPVPDPALVPWWRNVGERAIRQALQVAAPILAAVVASGNGLDLSGSIGAIIVAVVLSVLKSAAGVRADATASILLQFGDRALSAAAFTLLAFLPTDWLGWASVDWSNALTAAVAAGVLAAAQFYLNPPALAVGTRQNYARAA